MNLAAAPMTHTAGLLACAATARGGTVVVLPKANPEAVLDVIEQHGVTDLFLPPTVIYRLLDEPGLADGICPRCGTSSPGPRRCRSRSSGRRSTVFGPVMMQGYGQTEAPASIAMLRPEEYLVDGSHR